MFLIVFYLIVVLLSKFTVLLALSGGQWAILASHHSDNWGTNKQQRHHQQPQGAKCLEIPENFTLCHGMQYKSMHLPNLFEHETMAEVIEQTSAWVPLLRLHCHTHTKLFLCSLFAPICLPQLDKPIQPCQSLCRSVQQGCAIRMSKYGFPWPEMLNCSHFPRDNDLCIKPPPHEDGQIQKNSRTICKSCAQVTTFENLMDNFCRSSTVLKIRLRSHNSTHSVVSRRMRVFKSAASTSSSSSRGSNEMPMDDDHDHEHAAGRRQLRQLNAAGDGSQNQHQQQLIRLGEHGEGRCHCPFVTTGQPAGGGGGGDNTFLLMASERRRGGGGGVLNAKMLVPWRQEKAFKAAIRRFKKVNCSTLGREIRESVLSQMFRRRAVGLP